MFLLCCVVQKYHTICMVYSPAVPLYCTVQYGHSHNSHTDSADNGMALQLALPVAVGMAVPRVQIIKTVVELYALSAVDSTVRLSEIGRSHQ